MLLTFKIKLLLLIAEKSQAKSEAEQNYGHSPVLDKWIDCLRAEQFFTPLVIITETGLETKCGRQESKIYLGQTKLKFELLFLKVYSYEHIEKPIIDTPV